MERLGRYEIGRILGEGGAGRVYEAVLRGPGGFTRAVALKVLHSGADELRHEARLGGLLRHRHLVDVYEVGEADGVWFAALERCDGTLGAHAPLPPRALVEVGLQVCAALQYAHEELGLVHLDLKPSNLLLADGVVKVSDLGIARAHGFGGDGRVRGTPRYMAPEQAAGMAVDARSDVFALGITLYELALGAEAASSGTLDYDGHQSQSTMDVDPDDPRLRERPPPPGPTWLDAIVQRCAAPSPLDRFQSMTELAEALRAVVADGPGLRDHIGWVEDLTTAAEPRGTNLKPGRDGFFGRDRELAEIVAGLDAPGLITLKGPAGIGKSRLARAAALQWHGRGRQAWFVDLVDAREERDLVAELASTLRVPVAAGPPGDPLAALARSLVGRGPTVLVLDNFEQIVDLAPRVRDLLDRAPQLRVVATSRQPLRLAGERVVELGPVEPGAAVALLVDRARARGAVVEGDPDLPELARRLDGVPLALELAAGRLGVLSVRDVLDRLSLSLLRRAEEGRHGTLQAALEWSWGLMSGTERAALAQLSVFAGGFLLTDAEEVLAVDGAALDVIGALVDRSMVQALDGGRFGLLVSVHDFAAARLEDRVAVEVRHGRAFARHGRVEALEALLIHGGPARRQALVVERANLQVALARAIARRDVALAAPLAAAAYEAVEQTGPFQEIRGCIEAALALEPSDPLDRALLACCGARVIAATGEVEGALRLARDAVDAADRCPGADAQAIACGALVMASKVHNDQGATGAALAAADAAWERARAHGLRGWEGSAHTARGLAFHVSGAYDEAEAAYSEALQIFREVGNRPSEGGTLGNLGGLHQLRGDLDQTRACYDACLAIARELGHRRSEGLWLGNLGILLRAQGRPDEAREAYLAALAIDREVGNGSHIATTLSNLGRVEAEAGDLDQAERLFRESLELTIALGQRHSQAVSLANLGALERLRGAPAAAKGYLEEALAIAVVVGDPQLIGPIRGLIAQCEG